MRNELRSTASAPLLALGLLLGLAHLAPSVGAAQVAEPPTVEASDSERFAEQAEQAGGAEEEAFALSEDDDRVSIFGGSRTIEEGEVVGDVLVVGGNLRVRGEVRGDAVVVGGNLTLAETGRIHGDVVVAGGRFRDQGGVVMGEMRTMSQVRGVAAVERESRSESRSSPFGRIGRGFAGIVSTLALTLVLGAVGSLLIFYGFRYLETVSDTLRASTMRSAGVGLAAAFLIVPAFVVLIVALAVSIVGIPLLLVAVPLYPLAVVGATAFGLLAAAYAIGERTSEKRGLYDLRHRNAYSYLATGLGVLFVPVLIGHLVGMTPFLGWVGSLVQFFAYVAIWAVATVGLGAVVLSRAGTRRTFAYPPPPEHDPILDDDPFFERSDV